MLPGEVSGATGFPAYNRRLRAARSRSHDVMPLTPDQLAARARFVFHGTIQSIRPPDMRDVPRNAVTVRVDEVVQGPAKLTMFAGRDVFVVPRKGERFRAGERAIFYTNALVFGETLTLESIGHLPLSARAPGVPGAVHPAVNLRTRDVQQRLATADLVVVGRVTAVRLPPSNRPARGAAARSDVKLPPVSEHDPEWRDAVVDVARVAKGGDARKQVIVRFPASRDVRWFRSPKLSAGEEGVFILHRTEAGQTGPSARGARASAAPAAPVFTALHPQDVQPPDMQDEIEALLRSAPASPPPAAKRTRRRGVGRSGRPARRSRRSSR